MTNLSRWVVVFLFLFVSCSTVTTKLFWKEYSHPTYRFSLYLPKDWTQKTEGLMGSAVLFLAPEEDALFRANVNVVVENLRKKNTLKEIADRSEKQLEFLLHEYRLLARAPTKLGTLAAIELRGMYSGTEGARILRTIIANTDDMHYVVTFTTRADQEEKYNKLFEKVRQSFRALTNLRQE